MKSNTDYGKKPTDRKNTIDAKKKKMTASVQNGKTASSHASRNFDSGLPEHDNLASNLVLGEDSGSILSTSEMLDFAQGADSDNGQS